MNITPVGDSLLVPSKKLWRWYHNNLSGFLSASAVKERHQHDFAVKTKDGKSKNIRVQILEVDNLVADMAIDEKQIGGVFYTILTNRNSDKIALLAQTVNSNEPSKFIPKFGLRGFYVKSITRDLSPAFDWFSRQFFCNALHTADKFHIIRHLLDSCQDTRIRYKQELLTDKRLQYATFKQQEQTRKQFCKENNEPFIAPKFTYKTQKLSNGETVFEALSRSRYLLYKYSQNWSETQRERAVALFKLYPEIEKSEQLCCKFRYWYSKGDVGRSVDEMRAELRLWYSEVEKGGVLEMENFSSLVERNEGLILNYFVNGDTNAIAEAMNSKIQRMITMNKGTKNKEFFWHKMKKIFASTSK